MSIPSRVKLVDVGPRDGLQNEKQPVPAAVKIELVHRLQEAGLKEIEVTSYVSPKWVPQMADNAEVMAGIVRRPGVRYSVLTPNMKGLEAALSAPRELWPDEIVVFGAASEAFSQKNINCSIAESIERFAPVAEAARAQGIYVRGAMSCTVGCPYEGEIAPERVAYLAGLMKGIGVQHVGVADTIGEITAASSQQSPGVAQVNQAVGQLDQMTQQNAALVEQSSAAAGSLEQQAASLAQIVSTFRMHPEHGASHPAAPRAATVQVMGPRPALPAVQARVSPARGQPQVKEEEWAAF